MKALAIVFLLIGAVFAFVGYDHTSDKSYVALEIRLAGEELVTSKDYQMAILIENEGDMQRTIAISDKGLRAAVQEDLQAGRRPSELEFAAMMARVEASEAKLARVTNERLDKMKWTYGPAACLAVLGLILLVIPTQQKSSLSDQLIVNPSLPKLPPTTN